MHIIIQNTRTGSRVQNTKVSPIYIVHAFSGGKRRKGKREGMETVGRMSEGLPSKCALWIALKNCSPCECLSVFCTYTMCFSSLFSLFHVLHPTWQSLQTPNSKLETRDSRLQNSNQMKWRGRTSAWCTAVQCTMYNLQCILHITLLFPSKMRRKFVEKGTEKCGMKGRMLNVHWIFPALFIHWRFIWCLRRGSSLDSRISNLEFWEEEEQDDEDDDDESLIEMKSFPLSSFSLSLSLFHITNETTQSILSRCLHVLINKQP